MVGALQTHSIFIQAARRERPPSAGRGDKRFADLLDLRLRNLDERRAHTARGSLPIITSASFMRLCMSTQGSE